MHLRPAEDRDLPALLAIHNHAVRELTAAWTTIEDTLDDRRLWLEGRRADGLPVLVAVDEADQVLGYGTYGAFRARPGYRLTAEHSVYVATQAQGRGIGKTLMLALIDRARAEGYHVLVGAVDSSNEASLALHASLGFDVSCRLPQVGHKFGRWLDLVLASLVLDDRELPPAA